MSDRQYVIINADEVSSVNFDKVLESSAETLRYNVEGDKTFVKYEGAKPVFLADKQSLSHSEILEVLESPEWLHPIEDPA